MVQVKTPGVYASDPGFTVPVVAVETAVPAFIGYTERAGTERQPLTHVPVRIASMAEYEAQFGGPPAPACMYAAMADVADAERNAYTLEPSHPFLLYASLQLHFANGGAPCTIVSMGSYSATPCVEDLAVALAVLEQVTDVTLLVAPDVARLAPDAAAAYPALALAHCGKLQNRFAILDVPRGDLPRAIGAEDPINNFRASVGTDSLSYGAAYYPWLHTTVVCGVDFRAIAPVSMPAFQAALQREAQRCFGDPAQADQLKVLTQAIARLAPDMPAPQAQAVDQLLAASLDWYRKVMQDVLTRLNLLPPSGAMAGIYCRTDLATGVFTPPANVSTINVTSPAVPLTDTAQQDLSQPLDGKAVNAIRLFPNRGTVVWGARTLDGNAHDFRYLNVRRTLIMLEQSIKRGLQAYAFSPNDLDTWFKATVAINDFLSDQWKQGALQGSSPSDAFSVSVGLGSTMTGEDVMNGLMRVMVRVAVAHPAEFIVLAFEQQVASA